MNRPNVNLEDVFSVETSTLRMFDQSFTIKFMGESPTGRGLDVTVRLPGYFIEFLAQQLHKVITEQQKLVDDNKRAMSGDC